MVRLLLQELRFRRNAIIGWALGISLLPAMYVGIYPEFADQLEVFQEFMDLQIYQAMGINMGGFEDWVASTVVNIVPVLLAIFTIMNGTGTLAGEEDEGKLELIVALPIPRWQIVAVKAVALGISLFAILLIVAGATTLVFLSIESQIDTTITTGAIFGSLIYTWPLVMALGMISLFLSAFSPSRRIAALIATVIMVVSYFGDNLASQVEALETIQPFFLFHYLDATAELYRSGAKASDILVLLGVAVVAYLLATFFFQRRDITVGMWPWQRARAVPQ